MMKRILLITALVIPGLAAVAAFGYYALQDWGQLQKAYGTYRIAVSHGADLRPLTIAYNAQSIHRINLFADGTWTMLGAILAGIGVHGLCVVPRKQLKPVG